MVRNTAVAVESYPTVNLLWLYMKQNIWSEGHNCVLHNTHLCVIQPLIRHVICSASSELLELICGEIAKRYNIRAFIGRSWVQFPLSAHLTLTFHENVLVPYCLELVSVSYNIQTTHDPTQRMVRFSLRH